MFATLYFMIFWRDGRSQEAICGYFLTEGIGPGLVSFTDNKRSDTFCSLS